jgi:hypothetical protein
MVIMLMHFTSSRQILGFVLAGCSSSLRLGITPYRRVVLLITEPYEHDQKYAVHKLSLNSSLQL